MLALLLMIFSAEAEVPYNVTVTARNSAGMGDPEEIVNFTVQSDCKWLSVPLCN